jgi:hypothetical protein
MGDWIHPLHRPATVADVMRARNFVVRTIVNTGENIAGFIGPPVAYLAMKQLVRDDHEWYDSLAVVAVVCLIPWLAKRTFIVGTHVEQSEKALEGTE